MNAAINTREIRRSVATYTGDHYVFTHEGPAPLNIDEQDGCFGLVSAFNDETD